MDREKNYLESCFEVFEKTKKKPTLTILPAVDLNLLL